MLDWISRIRWSTKSIKGEQTGKRTGKERSDGMAQGQWRAATAALGAMALLVGLTSVGWAAETFKAAVIDQQTVLEKTKAGKRALDGLKDFSTSRQKIVSADDEELKRLEAELKDQEAGLSETAKRERQEQFRTKFENYQRRLQDFNREIQGKQRELAEEFQKKIDQATAAVAEKGGYGVVLDKGSDATLRIVIYANSAIDLTDQVVKEFDRRFK
jgi:outer membrane protein